MRWNQLVRELESATSAVDCNRGYDGSNEQVAYQVAKDRLEQAREAIRVALAETPWGQDGSAFVDDLQADWDRGRVTRLSINGRIRVRLYYKTPSSEKGWVEITPAKEAEERFQIEKSSYRAHAAWYARERELLVAALQGAHHAKLKSFAGYKYTDGQKGGTFCRVGSHIRVGAEGALRAAWGEEWEKTSFSAEEAEDEVECRFFGAKY